MRGNVDSRRIARIDTSSEKLKEKSKGRSRYIAEHEAREDTAESHEDCLHGVDGGLAAAKDNQRLTLSDSS